MKHIFQNWKTTGAGIVAIIGGIIQIVGKDTHGGIVAIVGGLGLIFAADAKKNQE